MCARLCVRMRRLDNVGASIKKFFSVQACVPAGKSNASLLLNQEQADQAILYKDDDIIALNKPAGLAVHGGPKLGSDLSHYMHYWQYEQTDVPHLAHRLDMGTSGVLLLTRHKAAAAWIAQLFHEHKITKKYWAITINVPQEFKGSIKCPLSVKNVARSGDRHSMNRVVMMPNESAALQAKLALTDYRVLSVSKESPRRCSLMQLVAVTGLKHQLRVHLADGLNCPVLGDEKFGKPLLRSDQSLRRKAYVIKSKLEEDHHLYLHARGMEIPGYHGDNNPPLMIRAPLPNYYKEALELLELTPSDHKN